MTLASLRTFIDEIGGILVAADLRTFGPSEVYQNSQGEIVTPSGDEPFLLVEGITTGRGSAWAARTARSAVVQVTAFAADPGRAYDLLAEAAEAIPTPPWIARTQSTGGTINGLSTAFQRFER